MRALIATFAVATFTLGATAAAAQGDPESVERGADDDAARGWWIAPQAHATTISPYIDRDRGGFSGGVALLAKILR